jgi:catechol 2,3-dioxygenase-like lactoylglutathione lyase family enzyme
VAIVLDHLIVPARDRVAAARRLAAVLGVPWTEAGSTGPFSPVYVSADLTLDFDQADGGFPVLHFAFRVDDAAFDALVARLRALGVAFRSTPHGPADAQVNTAHGGRIVYWSEPDGHVWEALTQSYARQGRTP